MLWPSTGGGGADAVEDPAYGWSMLQREAELLPLYIAVESAGNGLESQQASAALQQALDARSAVDHGVREAVSVLLSQPQIIHLLQVCYCFPQA